MRREASFSPAHPSPPASITARTSRRPGPRDRAAEGACRRGQRVLVAQQGRPHRWRAIACRTWRLRCLRRTGCANLTIRGSDGDAFCDGAHATSLHTAHATIEAQTDSMWKAVKFCKRSVEKFCPILNAGNVGGWAAHLTLWRRCQENSSSKFSNTLHHPASTLPECGVLTIPVSRQTLEKSKLVNALQMQAGKELSLSSIPTRRQTNRYSILYPSFSVAPVCLV